MKTIMPILKLAFVVAIAMFSSALSAGPTVADTIITAAYSNVEGKCQLYPTCQSNCDLEETSGVACTVVTPYGCVQAYKQSCVVQIYRDDD